MQASTPVYLHRSAQASRCYSKGITKDAKTVYLRGDVYIPDGILQAFIRIKNYTRNEFAQICQHHANAISLLALPPELLNKILSYTKLYFHILRITCKAFSHLKPVLEVHRFMQQLLWEGHLQAVKYVWQKFHVPINGWSHHVAALGGSIEVLKWLHEINCPSRDDVCSSAAMGGHLKAIKWALRMKYTFDSSLVSGNAARNGHIHLLRWLRKHDFLDSIATKNAVIGEKLNTLMWLKKKKVPLDESVCKWAVWRQNLEILEWLVENGALKTKAACLAAASCKSLKILKWLIENGFPYNTRELIASAQDARQYENIQWLKELETKETIL